MVVEDDIDRSPVYPNVIPAVPLRPRSLRVAILDQHRSRSLPTAENGNLHQTLLGGARICVATTSMEAFASDVIPLPWISLPPSAARSLSLAVVGIEGVEESATCQYDSALSAPQMKASSSLRAG